MGFEMHEIKEDEVKSGNDYSDLWKEVMKIYIGCFEKGKNVENKSILESRSKYLLEGNPINGKTEKGLKSHWLYFTDQEDKVGFAIIQDSGKKYCYIDYIGTTKKGGGYGRKIIEILSKKYKEIELTAIPKVYYFYKKCGFKPKNLVIKPREPRNKAEESLLGKQKLKIRTEKRNNKIGAEMFKINSRSKDDTNYDSRHQTLDDPEKIKRSKDDTEKPNRKK